MLYLPTEIDNLVASITHNLDVSHEARKPPYSDLECKNRANMMLQRHGRATALKRAKSYTLLMREYPNRVQYWKRVVSYIEQ